VAGQAGQRRAEAAGVAARPAAEELQELGNSGIAAALVLTLGTVEKHVASIFGKLGLPTCEGDNQRVLAVLRYLGS
jgi:DNA-binding CsgD family transcriptional regulator